MSISLKPALLLLIFLSACQRAVPVTSYTVAHGTIESIVSSITSGTVKAEQVTELAFGNVGRVATLKVKLGDRVKAGQILSELENADLITSLEVAEREYSRQNELYKSNVSAKLDLDRSREHRELVAMTLQKSIIRAPFDGIVTELNVEVGQLSQITAVIPKPMIRLVDEQPRYVRAEIDEVDFAKVKVGMPARIKILAVRKQPFVATLRKIIPAINSVREQDRTTTVELNVVSQILLPDGASADLDIIVEKIEDALVVPSRCVMGHLGKQFVFVSQNGRSQRREIVTGIRGLESIQINSGLQQGENVLLPADEAELSEGKRIKLVQ